MDIRSRSGDIIELLLVLYAPLAALVFLHDRQWLFAAAWLGVFLNVSYRLLSRHADDWGIPRFDSHVRLSLTQSVLLNLVLVAAFVVLAFFTVKSPWLPLILALLVSVGVISLASTVKKAANNGRGGSARGRHEELE